MDTLRVCLFALSALLVCACAYKDVSASAQALESEVEASEDDIATLHALGAQTVHQHPTRHRRDLPTSFLIPGGEGEGPWVEWGEVSPCSRTCGGGVASQKRTCLQPGPEGQSPCKGGDTKYFSCQKQDCPDGSGDFRAEQCAEFNDKAFRGFKYNWVPYTKAPHPCELYCRPHGERLYFRHKLQVTDGTRCDDVSFDVCVNGKCQPVGCDMMLNSTAREDKCRKCRGNGTNCRTTEGIFDTQDLVKGYNDILLIPSGSTSIKIEEVKPLHNYLALRAKNGTYYLNSHYHIDFPRTIVIAGALWTYERSQQGFAAPDKLRCLGPTTETLYLSLLLQDDNVGIKYEYSNPGNPATLQNVTGGILEEVEKAVVQNFTSTNKDVSRDHYQWVEDPWGECSQKCGSEGVRSREVTCQEIIYNSKVPDKPCFDFLGPKPELFQKCNEDAPCPTWSVGNWTTCDKLCDEGKQTRHVSCYQKKNGFIEMLDNEVCTEKKPEEEQPCMLKLCDRVDWFTSGWSGCDSCTSKFHSRTVVCATKSQTGLNESLCSNQSRPVDHAECNKDELPPCEVQWYATQWSKCSATCGEGVQTRKVFCGDDNARGEGVQAVEESMCDMLTKYNDTRPCTVPKKECPSQWFAGPWSECNEECGGGEQYRRVMCFRGNKVVSDCDASTVLDSVQVCNSESCKQVNLSVDAIMNMANDGNIITEKEMSTATNQNIVIIQTTTQSSATSKPIQLTTSSLNFQPTTSYAALASQPAHSTDAIPKTTQRANQNTTDFWTDQIKEIITDHNQGNRILILMRGMPGSGKSYLARQLVDMMIGADLNNYKTHILSTDDYFMVNGQYQYEQNKILDAHSWNQIRARNALAAGLSPVIIDNTNIKLWQMELYLRDGVKNGYIIQVVEPKTPWAKRANQLAKENVHNVSLVTIKSMLDNYRDDVTGNILRQTYGLAYPADKVPPVKRTVPPIVR